MNLIYRRITYTFFVILFLLITPIIILYTQGYRYDFNSGRIQKTGILIVSSLPKKADIYLNNKPYTERQTPAKIEKLLPGDYEIRLKKENYHIWQKKLPIYENNTTFAEKIVLWLDSLPIILKTDGTIDYKINNNKSQVALINNQKEVSILKIEDETETTIDNLDNYKQIKILDWLDNNKFIIQADARFLLVSENDITALSSIPIGAKNLKWDNRNIIYSLTNQGIWKTDLNREKSEIILAVIAPEDYLIDGNTIYTIKDRAVFESGKQIAKIDCQNCKFIKYQNNKIILLDKDDQKIVIIDKENQKPIITASAKDIDWLNKNTLLFYNDWEIWIYNFQQDEIELITRLGKPIESALWHNLGRHIIFASGDKISIIELDHRENRNITDIANISNVKFMYLDKNGEKLTINGKINNAERIFSLQIR